MSAEIRTFVPKVLRDAAADNGYDAVETTKRLDELSALGRLPIAERQAAHDALKLKYGDTFSVAMDGVVEP